MNRKKETPPPELVTIPCPPIKFHGAVVHSAKVVAEEPLRSSISRPD